MNKEGETRLCPSTSAQDVPILGHTEKHGALHPRLSPRPLIRAARQSPAPSGCLNDWLFQGSLPPEAGMLVGRGR